jgi:general secretion pathway protein B
MSYILDALKKSEQERAAQSAIAAERGALMLSDRGAARGRWAIVAALVLNAAVVAWLLRPAAPPEPLATAPATMPAQERQREPVSAPSAPTAKQEPALAALAQRAPARPAPVTAAGPTRPVAPTAPAVQPAPAFLPLVQELSDAQRRRLPPLQVNVHVYSETPQSRFVMLDLRRHQEGATIAEGLVLEQITPEGMILRLDGERFRLPVRP